MDKFRTALKTFQRKYYPLIKSLQTGLLLITGLIGILSSGITILNIIGIVSIVTGMILRFIYDINIMAEYDE